MGWYEQRFEQRPGRIECRCLHCSRQYWLPPSQASKRTTCGDDCRSKLNEAAVRARQRDCAHCGHTFSPRLAQIAGGGGQYCSVRCAAYGNRQLWTPQAREKAGVSLQAAIANGAYLPPKGEKHHQWAGGTKASTQRRIVSGKSREQLRAYRARRPDIQREAAHRRSKAKVSRLPRGTVQRIGGLQRWKCAACRCDLRKSGYHMDHNMPLAKGGAHAPHNIQLLCPPCNVRKSAKHPIDFMQERGWLL